MATKKTAPPRASAAKAKKPGKAPPVPIETAWQDLEATLRNTLGQNAAGQHPADLEPMHMTFEHAPDLSSLLPEDYQRFVEALGYRWVTTGKKGLSFLPRAGASRPRKEWANLDGSGRPSGRSARRAGIPIAS